MPDNDIGRTPRQTQQHYRGRVERAWHAMTQSGEVADGVLREVVAASWRRCRARGVEPIEQLPPRVAEATGFEELQSANRELLLASQNTWDLLTDVLTDTQSVLVVADPRGVILDVSGAGAVVERGASLCVHDGYRWSEEEAGTNAIGTAIATRTPTEVQSVEHYCAVAKVWCCAAAPVHDRVDGELLGVIDITTFGETHHGHTLALAATAAQQIEQTLTSRELARQVQLLEWYQANLPRWSNEALVLLDRKGRLVTGNGHAHALFRDRDLAATMTRGAALLAPPDSTHGHGQDLPELPFDLRAQALEPYRHGKPWAGGLLVLDGVRRAPRSALVRHGDSSIAPAFDSIVGSSPALHALKVLASRAAATSSPVLLSGETGTGKERFARAIHDASARAAGPWVAVNCGTLTRELAASELFGHEPGAFTGALPHGRAGKFEQADGGTLFLDEVGELPPEVQVQLLRVLQDGVVTRIGGHRERRPDVRVIAASNRDLGGAVAAGDFREDLYYRLRIVALQVPPLRERREDIPALVEAFVIELNQQHGLGPKRATGRLLDALGQRTWRGNVRELRGVVESMYVLGSDPTLDVTALPADATLRAAPGTDDASPATATIEQVERHAILRQLTLHDGNRSAAARALGISRNTLYRRLARYGLR